MFLVASRAESLLEQVQYLHEVPAVYADVPHDELIERDVLPAREVAQCGENLILQAMLLI